MPRIGQTSEGDEATGGTVTQTITVVTTAPESCDGFGTHTLELLPYRSRARGAQYRSVAVRADAVDWQASRYRSAQHSALPREEFDTWVELGLVEPIL
jgi:hypothetical protein